MSTSTTHFHEVVKLVKEHCITKEGEHYLTIRVYGPFSKNPITLGHEFFFHSPHNANKRIPIENRNTLSFFKSKKGD